MGFPSPAADYVEQRINLNDLVRGYPSSTIALMCGKHMAIVNAAQKPRDGNEVLLRYQNQREWGIVLMPAGRQPAIRLNDNRMLQGEDLEEVVIEGVVVVEVHAVMEPFDLDDTYFGMLP